MTRMKRLLCALLISLCLVTPALALSDETLRTAFWLSSLSSLGQVGQQSHDGTREINPALSGLFGDNPSFGEVAGLNLAYRYVCERIYQDNPQLARWLWGLGTAMAVYWICYDSGHGIDGPDKTVWVTFTIARW
jgi:hypothetical protein